jgi:hypothetical protein
VKSRALAGGPCSPGKLEEGGAWPAIRSKFGGGFGAMFLLVGRPAFGKVLAVNDTGTMAETSSRWR